MEHYTYYEYLEISGEKLFTVILLPEKVGKFPSVICRTPYVGDTVYKSEEEIVQSCLEYFSNWLKRGYAIVYQHCKGQGKSSGEFVPYIHEREDGILLREWIRQQSFYNGELFLTGGSYTASLHYSTAPFEDDIKGAIFEVQDSERYNLWYRNGQMRKGHANWHFELYKAKCGLNKNFNINSFNELPLKDLSERVLGERTEDFEQMLTAESPDSEFWNTRFGGQDARKAVIEANIPILLTTGYNDFYVGGIFKMWNNMPEQTKKMCALLVSPYNHGDGYNAENGLFFPLGRRDEQFGATYQIDWFDNIRLKTHLPYPKGVITYYRAFQNKWASDFHKPDIKINALHLGDSSSSFEYNPKYPTTFSEEGTFFEEYNPESAFIRVYTKPFDKDIFIRGQIKADLVVSSNCEDSSFFMCISIKNSSQTYVLRKDITSLCYQLGEYTKNDVVTLQFCFDEYAFLLKKGEVLQIDIASTDNSTYVPHTNKKGDYYLQTDTNIAINTIYLEKSHLYLPIEE